MNGEGVAVWRYAIGETGFYLPTPTHSQLAKAEPGRWYAEAYAAALVELADAVPYHIGNLSTAEAKRIIAILDRLAAAKAVK